MILDGGMGHLLRRNGVFFARNGVFFVAGPVLVRGAPRPALPLRGIGR